MVIKIAASYALGATVFALLNLLMSSNIFTGIFLVAFYLVDFIIIMVFNYHHHKKFSLVAEVTKFFAKAFYDVRILTQFIEVLETTSMEAGFEDEAAGPVEGNSFIFSQEYAAEFSYTDDADDNDIDDSTSYGWLHATADDAQVAEQNTHPGRDIGDSTFTTTNDARVEVYFDQPKRNIKIEVSFDIHTRAYYETCSLWGASCTRRSVIFDLPDDLYEYQRWQPTELYMDVIPDNIDDFRTWSELNDPDRDADGLSNDREAELGTNPDHWDTDLDGLEDKFELDQQDELGCDPLLADTDADGLSDGLEYRLQTEIGKADSDDDGLAGW